MCLIGFAWKAHPRYTLMVAANRDEFFARPAAPAHWWHDAPDTYAGRDLQADGTWMGFSRSGRFAALTNVRDGRTPPIKDGPSRGELASRFLDSEESAPDYLEQVLARGQTFNGFNLLLADQLGNARTAQLLVGSNRSLGAGVQLEPGVYALSNASLDTPWPKTRLAKRGMALLATQRADGDAALERMFALLANRDPAPDALLPDTGVSTDWERSLSSAFIVRPDYGTRASTVLTVDLEGRVTMVERTFMPTGTFVDRRIICDLSAARSA